MFSEIVLTKGRYEVSRISMSFVKGLFVGIVLAVGMTGILYFALSRNPPKSHIARQLEYTIEALPVEQICEAFDSDKVLSVKEHISVWTDKKYYFVGGWVIDKDGAPTFYWRGANVPTDVPACAKN